MCSECYIKRLAKMQSTSYSVYDDWYKEDLELVYERCGKEGPTEIPPSLDPVSEKIPTFCVSDNTIETSKGNNTCEEIALHNNVSPAALYSLNPDIQDCSSIADGTKLCLPLACASLVKYAKNDTCTGLEREGKMGFGDLRRFNPWINFECNNLETGGKAFGWVLCTEPQNGRFDNWGVGVSGDTVTPHPGSDYTAFPIDPPNNSTVAEDSTTKCGRWYVTEKGDSCSTICMSAGIHISLLLAANPSLGKDLAKCSENLVPERAYCTGPTYEWAE